MLKNYFCVRMLARIGSMFGEENNASNCSPQQSARRETKKQSTEHKVTLIGRDTRSAPQATMIAQGESVLWLQHLVGVEYPLTSRATNISTVNKLCRKTPDGFVFHNFLQ